MADTSSAEVDKIEYNAVELPPTVVLKESSVVSGEAGAFSKTLIPKDTRFGPYKGEIIQAGQKEYIDYRFAWEVFEKDSDVLKFTISAMDSKTSNWMRHVNCARFYEEQNIISVQDDYSIFYVAMKDINPGEELLTWFDPKLLKRTRRRMSKMKRKPVGYTIELVPWDDEKKFIPEIIETKRARKKKVLSDMIPLDENPLAITRMLQKFPKIPCTPKQLAQSSFNRTILFDQTSTSLKTPRAVVCTLPKTKTKSILKGSSTVKVNLTKSKVNNEQPTFTNTGDGKCESVRTKSFSVDLKASDTLVGKRESNVLCSEVAVDNSTKTQRKMISLLRSPVKQHRSYDMKTKHGVLTLVKPVVIKQNTNGSTTVEDHDETYILHGVELRLECDDKCPCLNDNKYVTPHVSDQEEQSGFIIHFNLLPEHKSVSFENKTIYRCDVCGNAYNHAFSLKRHYLSVHVNHRYLSRDDIVSCQIETFHTGIQFERKNSEAEIHCPLVMDSMSSSTKKEHMSISAKNASQKNRIMNKCHENFEDGIKDNANNETKILNRIEESIPVPSLKTLSQMTLDKTKVKTSLQSTFDFDKADDALENFEHRSIIANEKSVQLCPIVKDCKCVENIAALDEANMSQVKVDSCVVKCVKDGNACVKDGNACVKDGNACVLQNVQISDSEFTKCNEDSFSKYMAPLYHEEKLNEKSSPVKLKTDKQNACNKMSPVTFDTDSSARNSENCFDLSLGTPDQNCIDRNASTVVNNQSQRSALSANLNTQSSFRDPKEKDLFAFKESGNISKLIIDRKVYISESSGTSDSLDENDTGESPDIVNSNSCEKVSKKEPDTALEIIQNNSVTSCAEAPVKNCELIGIFSKQNALSAKIGPISVLSGEFSQTFKCASTTSDSFETTGLCGSYTPATGLSSVTNGNEISALHQCSVQASNDLSHTAESSKQDHSGSDFILPEKSAPPVTDSSPFSTCVISTITNTAPASTSVAQSQLPQQLILVTNIVFPIVSQSPKQVQAPGTSLSSSVLQSLTAETNKTNQATGVPLVVISPVSCGLTAQNALLQSSTALKTLHGIKNSFSAVNTGKGVSELSVLNLPANNKPPVLTSVYDNITLGKPPNGTSLVASSGIHYTQAASDRTVKPVVLNQSSLFTTTPLLVYDSPSPVTTVGSVNIAIPVPVTSSISSLISPNKSQLHSGDQPDDLYRCHMCVRLFKTMNELKQHIRNDPHRFKGGIKQYACLQCSMRFSNKNNLMRHNLMNHPENENYKFRCYTCGKGFTSEAYLKLHARFHSGKNFPCKYGCVDIYFPNAASLVKHLRTQHAGLNLKEFIRNSKAEKAHKQKEDCTFRMKDDKNSDLKVTGERFKGNELLVTSSAQYSLDQPGMGFQAKRGRSRGTVITSKLLKNCVSKYKDSAVKTQPIIDGNESLVTEERYSKLRFVCKLCLRGFGCHLKLLQHRSLDHGANQSVQEYLYEMSQDKVDEEPPKTENVKLEQSPPPSPKTFFQNVINRGLENMQYYIDGDRESLQRRQSILTEQDAAHETNQTSELQKGLQWTMFNFSPCFEYKEDCTTFYNSTDKLAISHMLVSDMMADDKKDSLKLGDADMKSKKAVNSLLDISKQSEKLDNSLEECDNTNLGFKCKILPSTNVSSCTINHHKCSCVASTICSHMSCDAVNGTESSILKPKKHNLSHGDTDEEGRIHSGLLSASSAIKDDFMQNSRMIDSNKTSNKVEANFICKFITSEIVSRAVMFAEKLSKVNGNIYSAQLAFNGNSDETVCQSDSDLEGTHILPEDSVSCLDISDVSDSKQECVISEFRENSSAVITKDTAFSFEASPSPCHTFRELSNKEKLQSLKRRTIQGLGLETPAGNYDSCLNNMHDCRVKVRDSGTLLHRLIFLVDAINLHVTNKQLSISSEFNHKPMSSFRQNTSSLESCKTPKTELSDGFFSHTLDSPFNNFDTSRHDHKRYSIWVGQVHQKFDSNSKDDIFCQPVTDLVRKQAAIQEQAKYNSEKSVRDRVMYKKHQELTQKVCFAQSLGLMTRKEFELSHCTRRQREFIIKVPEVWGNYENIWFGKKGTITVVCSVCHRHFSCWDLCLRHQLKKHPHIEPASLEMEKDNYVEDMYYYYPMPYGILAKTHLIPDNLPSPEVYVCTKCSFPFKNLNRLHAHIIICDPTQEINANQTDNLKKTCMKQNLPLAGRLLHQQTEKGNMKVRQSDNCVDANITSNEIKHSKVLVSSGKRTNVKLPVSEAKPITSAIQNCTTTFSFYSGKKTKHYEPLYNPQNHKRRRKMYKVLDQHQCHGCNLKFTSLSMLERHVNKCSGKDKLQSQKPLLNGIMPDDAALRKQHTCRYCSKRFTYIKGVDLHYKRICAVRKIKEEENQLTDEDLAHEAELKKIIEHIKWSKSLNKDSSDIIQGHVKVDEDGTLTRIIQKREYPQSLNKKVKKKGLKWTSLRKHQVDGDVSHVSSASSITEKLPVLSTKDINSPIQNKTSKKLDGALNSKSEKRITRSTSLEAVNHSHESMCKKQMSPDKKANTMRNKLISQSLTGSPSKGDDGLDSFSAPLTSERQYHGKVSQVKIDLLSKIDLADSIHYKNTNKKNSSRIYFYSTPKMNINAVKTEFPVNVETNLKPPARKRGRPQRFDPSDMESSYKKRKKDDHECILSQTEVSKSCSDRKKRNGCNKSLLNISPKRQKYDDSNIHGYVLRKKSSVLDSPVPKQDKADVHALKSTSLVTQSSSIETSKLFAKMKRLKEAAKLETNKSRHRKKSLSVVIRSLSGSEGKNANYNHKKGHSESKNYKPASIKASSSELLKHLISDKTVLKRSSSQKSLSKSKRVASCPSHSVNSITTLEGPADSAKQFKKIMLNTASSSTLTQSAHAPIVIKKNRQAVSGLKTCSKTSKKSIILKNDKGITNSDNFTSPVRKMNFVKTSAAQTTVSTTTTLSNIPKSKSKEVLSVNTFTKQPFGSVRVVTLSPNRTNLLMYDGPAHVTQPTIPKISNSTLSTSGVQNFTSKEAVHFLGKIPADLQPKEHTKPVEEQMKVYTIDKGIISFESQNIDCVQISDKLVATSSNIQTQSSLVHISHQGVPQKAVTLYAQHIDNNVEEQELHKPVAIENEDTEIVHISNTAEEQTSIDKMSNKYEKVTCIHRTLDIGSGANSAAAKHHIGGQIILSSNDGCCKKLEGETVPHLSVRDIVKHSSEGEINLLCNASQFLQKQIDETVKIDSDTFSKQNPEALNSISPTLIVAKPSPHYQNREAVANPNRQHTVNQISKLVLPFTTVDMKPSNVMSVKSTTNSLSLASNHRSVSTIIVSSRPVKTQIVTSRNVPSLAPSILTFSARNRPSKQFATLAGRGIPNLVQGSLAETDSKMLKLGTVSNIRSSEQPVTTSISCQYTKVISSPYVPAIITKKPLHLSASHLPRFSITDVHHQHQSTQKTFTQSLLSNNISRTTIPTLLPSGKPPAKSVSHQISIPQCISEDNINTISQSVTASIGTAGSDKTNKTSISSCATTQSSVPESNQIMFTLDDGTTAMLDPDSLAQFLTVSPSLSKSDLCSVTSLATGTDPSINVSANVSEGQLNQQSSDGLNCAENC